MMLPPRFVPESAGESAGRSIFDLLSTYHRSLDNMKRWLQESDLDEVERIGIADAWQSEMNEWFRDHGYCFACNRPLVRCSCAPDEPVASE